MAAWGEMVKHRDYPEMLSNLSLQYSLGRSLIVTA